MKTKFELGERIVAYTPGAGRIICVVDHIDSDGLIKIASNATGTKQWVHPKQCRKLRKKSKPIGLLLDNCTVMKCNKRGVMLHLGFPNQCALEPLSGKRVAVVVTEIV